MNAMVRAKRRRGMSFIEVIASTVLIVLVGGILLGLSNVISGNMQNTLVYSEMKLYAIAKIDQLQLALEQGYEIDAENYNDTDNDANVVSEIFVVGIDEVHGKRLYRVDIKMTHKETGTTVTTTAVLREGCIAHAP